MVLELSESVMRKYTVIGLSGSLSTTSGTVKWIVLPSCVNSSLPSSPRLYTVLPHVSGMRHSSTDLNTGATRSDTVIEYSRVLDLPTLPEPVHASL